MDLANNSLANQFVLISSNNYNNIIEEATNNTTSNLKVPTEERPLLTSKDII